MYTNLQVYEGGKWEYLGNNDNLSIDCFTITENGVPYGIASTDLYTYQNDSWIIVDYELLFVTCPMTSSANTLYFSLSQVRGVVEYNTTDNQYHIISVFNKKIASSHIFFSVY